MPSRAPCDARVIAKPITADDFEVPHEAAPALPMRVGRACGTWLWSGFDRACAFERWDALHRRPAFWPCIVPRADNHANAGTDTCDVVVHAA